MKTIQRFLTKTLFLGALIIGITISPSFSQAQTSGTPTADAGPDQTITLPTNSVTVSGNSSGINGFVIYYSWTSLSGTGNIVSPSSATTDITGLTAGTHSFRFTATNNTGDTAWDDINIFVNPDSNPGGTATVNAGPDQVLYYPVDQTNLSGSSSGINGIVLYYTWTRLSGSGTITSPNTSSTTVSSLGLGDNVFRLTVTNNTGTTASDDVTVTVRQAGPPLNIPPTAYAGPDQTITLPSSSTYLVGNGTDSDGTVVSYVWTKISGSGTISSAGTADSIIVSGLTLGTSVFRLTVTDNDGGTGTDDVSVFVLNNSTGGGGGGGTGGGGSGGGGGGVYICPIGTVGTYPNCVINTTNPNPIYFVNTAKLNIRSTPSALSTRLTTVSRRTLLEVLEGNRSSTWVKVKTNTGITGYVMTRYTEQLVKVGNRALITVRLVNVRSDESLRYQPLRTIRPTDLVEIMYVSPITSWVKIKSADGRTGFVNKFLLKAVQ